MIALYIRRSQERVEDSKYTIENQRMILKDYLKEKHMQWLPYDEYIDSPYSGMNFKRPGWKRMLEDCKSKRIDTVIAKDMSRLGRNYIELNEYLDDIFPELGIRVITVTENYDSFMKNGDNDLYIKAQNIMNTFYVKDLAVKRMSAKRAKWKRGISTRTICPYGYICKGIREDWETDPEAAEVVKRIFSMRLEGKKPAEIAKVLNSEQIPTPVMRRAELGLYKQPDDGRILLWNGSTVSNILDQEEYTGVLLQGKTICVSPGLSKMKKMDEEDWFRVEDHHEALVSGEDFAKAKEMKIRMKKQGGKREPHEHYFRSLIRCGNCGRMLAYSSGRYTCPMASQAEFSGCPTCSYSEEELKELAWEIIREKQEQAKVRLEQQADLEVSAIEARAEELKEERKAAYRDYVAGKISLEKNLAVKDRVGKELEGLKEEIVRRNVQKMDHYRMVQALEDLLRVDEPSPANFRRIVEAVYVNEDEMRVELKADPWLG